MSWPWKKKSSDKASVEKVAAILDSAGSTLSSTKPQAHLEKYKKPNYVQISLESYSRLTGLEEHLKTAEDHVQTLEKEINELNEKLSEAESELMTKESLVKQHSKVAEEAVSGWEKAEAEALALKNHLESVTLDKLAAEDRAAHLDGALKECMRQIRNLKEEHEKNLEEVVLTKTKQCEKIKHEFEVKMDDLDQELRKSAAENAALSRSLQERSNMLIKMTEEKTQAEAEIEVLKGNIEVCEKEINSLKYELHVVTKELDIRNEEKNMSVRSAEVANKQHLEGVKKIAKLEAECQRLRGLVRKKLPGPAALAQMKLEVESLGRDHGDPSQRRSPGKPPSARMPSSPDYSFDGYQKFHKENEFLTERMLAMEEDTKMLKEALAQRNTELQASRTMCAKTTNKLQMLEQQLENGKINSPKSFVQVSGEASLSHKASNPPSMTSMSEDGNDDDRSCAESWPSESMSEFSQFNKEKSVGMPKKADGGSRIELMDDFLEMEKLAYSSDVNGSMSSLGSSTIKKPGHKIDASVVKELEFPVTPTSSTWKSPAGNLESRISSIISTMSKDGDISKVLEDIKQAVDACDSTQKHQAETPVSEKDMQQGCPGDELTVQKDLDMSVFTNQENHQTISPDLKSAINKIHEFVLFLGKEAMGVHGMSTDGDELIQKINAFSDAYKKVISSEASLFDFILELSCVLTKAEDLKLNIIGYKGVESVANSPDYVDKVALPGNGKMVQQELPRESYQNGHAISSDLASHPDVSDDGTMESGDDTSANQNATLLEDNEKLRSENDKMATDLARSTEDLEAMKSKLQQTEQLLAEFKSQLASALNSFSLAETQLKCMAESYRSLEMRSQEIETEVNLLRANNESLDNELQEEKRAHQDALDTSKDLQDQLDRIESRAREDDADAKSKQEMELAAAAEKLAECQQTIFLLGKQLNSLRPPNAEAMGSPISESNRYAEGPFVHQATSSGKNSQEFLTSAISSDRTGLELQADLYGSFPGSPAEAELGFSSPTSSVNSRRIKHRPTLSTSSTTCSTPDKQARGFSRFFSSKGKNSAY